MSEPEYLPTPEQIRAACERIRDGWSPEEESARRGGDQPAVVPVFSLIDGPDGQICVEVVEPLPEA